MTFEDKRLNVGLLIKCLHENFAKGKNEYTIHEDWWKISDIEKLTKIVNDGFLYIEGRKISLTEKGKRTIEELYKEKKTVAIEDIYSQIFIEAERILEAFS